VTWLGIDLGTSGVKCVITDDAGAVLAEATEALDVQRPHPLWSEQDPSAWWLASKAAILQLPSNLRQSVRGIGLSGQMHGAVLLDQSDAVLRPAILWNDGRSAPQCVGLEPKDYLRLLLTGEKVSEMSDASGTLWLDVAERRWSPAMLDATGLSEAHMPALVEGSQVSGTLLSNVADELGLPVVPVAGGGGDQAAGAIGAGVVSPGQAFLSLGTSGVTFAAGAGFQPAPENGLHAFCHALPDRWHTMAVMLSAASCLACILRIDGRYRPR